MSRGKFGGEEPCNPLEMGTGPEGRLEQVLSCRPRDETGEIIRGGEEDEYLQLAYLVPWLEWPEVSQGMTAGVGWVGQSNDW